MALIKVKADERTRAEVINIVDIFRGKVIDVGPSSYIVEVTGAEDKIRPSSSSCVRSGSWRSCAPERWRCIEASNSWR